MIGAFAMSISSFLVVSSSLTINLFKSGVGIDKKGENVNNSIRNSGNNCLDYEVLELEGEQKNNNTENKTEDISSMNNVVIIKIEGMMCPHCSGRVKALLEALEAVDSADVSHERGDAIITLKAECELSVLEKVITDAGYKVVG